MTHFKTTPDPTLLVTVKCLGQYGPVWLHSSVLLYAGFSIKPIRAVTKQFTVILTLSSLGVLICVSLSYIYRVMYLRNMLNLKIGWSVIYKRQFQVVVMSLKISQSKLITVEENIARGN